MIVGRDIPQHEDTAQPWSRFLYKASRGSEECVQILVSAEGELEERFNRDVSSALPTRPPWATPAECYGEACDLGLLQGARLSFDGFLHPASFYAALWKRKATVDVDDLFHDAALRLFESWDVDTYVHLRDSVLRSHGDFNSLSAVVAMLLLTSCIPRLC